MYGPKPLGFWSSTKASNSGCSYRHLVAGKHYQIEREFSDYDGYLHSSSESWIFMGYSFTAHDDGLSLFVSLDGEHEWHIRMQKRPEEQGVVIDALPDYLMEESE